MSSGKVIKGCKSKTQSANKDEANYERPEVQCEAVTPTCRLHLNRQRPSINPTICNLINLAPQVVSLSLSPTATQDRRQ
ncbi:hypothetical protein E2C01_088133 [Portunus trituberculatus]|uniref:Uncharacterized protein n=1 Tax=Portunus trituberculatus TaxID=210409 RepID=A0A5B7JJ22_PORTR|nr:hypothetical protein [Portunus trituberculatus]